MKKKMSVFVKSGVNRKFSFNKMLILFLLEHILIIEGRSQKGWFLSANSIS